MDRRARGGLHHGIDAERGGGHQQGPAPLPPPVAGKTVNAKVRAGKVRFRLPGQTAFVELTAPQQLPMGTTFDTTAGRVTLTSAADAQGATQHAWFYEGTFTVGQTTGSQPLTTLTLAGALPDCTKGARAAASTRKQRHLWGRRQGALPHRRALQRGDRCGHPLGRLGPLRRHPHARRARVGHRPRSRAQQDRDPPRGPAVPRARAREQDAVSWVSVFAGFLVAHMVGDYLLQTDWQARHKRAGLSDPAARRPLLTHVATYTLGLRARVRVDRQRARRRLGRWWRPCSSSCPHLVVDDGRVVRLYLARVKARRGLRRRRRLVGRPVLPRALAVARGAAHGGRVNRRARRVRTLLLLAAMVVIAGGVFALERTDALQRLEYSSVNERFAIRGQRPPPSKLAIVAIDTKTFQDLNVHWPFRRKYHARVIRNLTKAGAKVIAYDVQFTEAQGNTEQDVADDNALILAVRAHPGTIMSTTNVFENGKTRIFGGDEGLKISRATRRTATSRTTRTGASATSRSRSTACRRSRSRRRAPISAARSALPSGNSAWIDFRGTRRASTGSASSTSTRHLRPARCAARSSWSATRRRRAGPAPDLDDRRAR
jgi:hypothetical protein